MRRLLVLLALVGAPLSAQGTDSVPPAPATARYPFSVGERFNYQVKFGIFSVGRATMEVMGIDTLRAQETFRFRLTINGRALFFSLDDTLQSWTDIREFHSFRFFQRNNEDGKIRVRDFLIYPDSGFYRQPNRMDTSYVTVPDPLDDVAFFYWVRTLPLVVGETYTWDRYFMPDRNPVSIRVLKRQKCELPHDERRQCLLIQPTIKSSGLLSEAANARILITDDVDRIPVEVRTSFSFGTLSLKLRGVTRGAPAPALVAP